MGPDLQFRCADERMAGVAHHSVSRPQSDLVGLTVGANGVNDNIDLLQTEFRAETKTEFGRVLISRIDAEEGLDEVEALLANRRGGSGLAAFGATSRRGGRRRT